MNGNQMEDTLFAVGDYVGGALIGGTTAAAVRGLVSPETDMVVAMLIGMAAGMILHLVIGLLMTPLLGMFHSMIPGSVVGMYGGMLFGMRDSMQGHAGSLSHVIGIGVAFGIVVIAAMRFYDRVLRSPVRIQPSGPNGGH